jgi:hypothetical protein
MDCRSLSRSSFFKSGIGEPNGVASHASIMILAVLISPICAFAKSPRISKTPAPAGETSATTVDYFRLRLTVGQKIGNVFSKTVSHEGGGIDESARNIGGTDLYQVIDASPDRPRFISTYRYDGRAAGSGAVEIRDMGQNVCSVKSGKCQPYLDDSGAFFDAFLWGKPSGMITPGSSWKVELPVPWELGPPGTETVTVIQVDPINHQVMLRREGSGEGFFADEPKQMKVNKDGKEYIVDVTPGPTHWIGYTVFREGLTVSDEMMETRQLTISSKELERTTITERQFTLLNQAPANLIEKKL